MIAIQSRYFPATDIRGSCILAKAEYGRSIVYKSIPYPHEYNAEDAHRAAALALIDKVNSRGGAWSIKFVTGSLPDDTYCHVLQH